MKKTGKVQIKMSPYALLSSVLAFVIASHHSSDGDVPGWMALVGIAIIGVVAVVIYLSSESSKSKKQQQRFEIDNWNHNRYLEWRAKVDATGQISPLPCGLLLKKGEECLYVAHQVTLYEVRAVRHSTHNFGSIPLGSSRVRIGSGRSTSYSTDEWTPIAFGELYVTNKQIYFDGDKQDRKILMEKIATIEADYSAVEISSDTRQKSMVFTDCNGQIIRDVVQLVRNENM